MTASPIEFRGVSKVYKRAFSEERIEALSGVSFEVGAGEVCGFLGPNGAGKTTSISILMGFLFPNSGEVRVLGLPPGDIRAKQQIGFLPENFAFYRYLTGPKLLGLHLALSGQRPSDPARLISGLLAQVKLNGYESLRIGRYSRGMVQRLGIAQALIGDPQLLIFDEPTSGLDPNQIAEIRHLIKELGREKTVILSTHILSEVQSTCDRVLIINEGKLVADDSPERLASAEGGTITVVLASRAGAALQAADVRNILERVPGVSGVEAAEGEGVGTLGFALRYGKEDPRRALFETAVRNALVLLEVRRKHVSLEETFRKLTAGESPAPAPSAAAA